MIYTIKSKIDLPGLSMAGFKMTLSMKTKELGIEIESLEELQRFQKFINKPINLNGDVITIGELC